MGIKAETTPINIVLVDDFRVVVERLKMMLQAIPGLNVVGEASSIGSAIAQVEALKPDAVNDAIRELSDRGAVHHWAAPVVGND